MRKTICTLTMAILVTVFFNKSVYAQPGTMMPNHWIQIPAACGFTFYDDGGMVGPFQAGAHDTMTLTGNGTNKVQLIFNSFNVGTGTMYIYDGMNPQAPPRGSFTGTSIPPNITATNANGALTIVFIASASMPGWNATISCVGGGGGVNFMLNPSPQCAPYDISNLVMNNSTYDSVNYWYVWKIRRQDMGQPKDSARLAGYIPSGYTVHSGHIDVQLFVSLKTDSSNIIGQDYKMIDINNDISELQLVPAGGSQICPNSNVSFQVQGGSYNMVQYYYHGSPIQNNTVQFGSITGPDSVNAQVFMNGCNVSLTSFVDINFEATPQPKILVDFGKVFCKGEKIRFKTDANFKSYSWDFAGLYTSNEPSPEYAFNTDSNMLVTLSVYNTCYSYPGHDTMTLFIRPGIKPSASFSYNNNYNDGRVCRNTPIQYSAQSPGTYKWYFGDGTTDTVPYPVKIYKNAGPHNVKLVVTNSCSNKDSTSQPVQSFQSSFSKLNNISFSIATDQQNNDPKNNQTVVVCPGDSIHFINSTGTHSNNESFSFRWNFGNGISDTSINPVQVFPAGNKNYMVTLSAVNNCGATGITYQYITIDNTLAPRTDLQILPSTICPGEKVFFYDEHYHEKYDRLKYSITFGDSQSANNLVNLHDKDLSTLAEHQYKDTGTYNYVFTATNACNNSIAKNGKIHVTTVPHAPMYYIENSTQSNNQDGPKDWSVQHLPGDARMDIPVRWPVVNTSDSTFYLFFFRGGFNPNDQNSNNPAGLVKFKATPAITTVQFVSAYIPYESGLDTVGIGFGHFCYSHSIGASDKPDLYALPVTKAGQPIYKYPINRENITILSDTITLPIDASNVCTDSKPYYGQWNFDAGSGEFYTLEIKQDQDSLQTSPIPYAAYKGYYRLGTKRGVKETEISSGSIYESSYYIHFYDSKCPNTGSYMYNFDNQSKVLSLMNYGDPCTNRGNLLSTIPYTPADIFDNTIASCPFTPVKFVVAGGNSVNWYFGDSVGPQASTKVAYHAYDTAGIYTAFARVTDSCGRTDSVRTKVVISNYSGPSAQISYNDGNSMIMAGMPVKFEESSSSDDTLKFTCFWKFGDGATSNLSKPTHIYLQPGDYTVSLNVVNDCGSDSASAFIHVSKSFTPTCAAEFSYLVTGNTVEFYNVTDKPGNTFSWNFGDFSIPVNGKNPVHTYAIQSNYTVCLRAVSGPDTCTTCQMIELSNGRPCSAAFTYSYQGSSISFMSMEPTNGIYSWDFGDGTKGNGQYVNHSYTNEGWYRVKLVTISPNCTDSFSNWIQIHNTICAQPNLNMVIDGNTVYINNYTNNRENLGWFWDYGDGTTSKAIDPLPHTFMHSGVYYMYMTMFDQLNGCKIKLDTTILIGSVNCYAYFTVDSTNTDSTVVFHNRSSIATKYIWDFGDGTISRLQNPPVKHYKKSGVYNVCLTVVNVPTSCTQTYCKEVSIGQVRCEADFAYIVDTTSAKVNFTNMSSDANNYFWDFGDGSFGFSKDTSHVYTKPGIYNVDLSIWNEASQCYNEVNKNILVAGQSAKLTTANFDYFVKEGNDSVLFINKSSSNVTKYYWTFGDGTFIAIKDPVKIYQKAGIFNVCLTVFDAKSGNSDRLCKPIAVGTGTCNITAGIGYLIDSTKTTVHFADKSTGDYNNYYWTFGDGSTSADSAPVKSYSTPGFYLVTLAVKKFGSTCVDFASEFIEIGKVDCKANFDYVVNDSSNQITFTNLSSGTVSNYYWHFDDGSFALDKNPKHTFDQQGMHAVSLTVSDAGSTCMDFADKKIQIGNVNCSAHFTYYVDIDSLTTWCKNEALGPATQYYWSFGDGSFSTDTNPVHHFNYPGYYTIGLNTYNAATGCMDFYKTPVLIGSEGIDCQADFIYKVDTTQLQVAFSSRSIGNINKYTWDFGDGTATASDKDTLHIFPHKGYYDVCLSVVNDKGVPNMICKWIEVAPDSKTNCYADFDYSINTTKKQVFVVDKSLGQPVKLNWDLGDNTTSSQKDSLSHSYTKAGYYLISLHITTITGCESFGYKLINIGQPDGIHAKFGYNSRQYNAKAGGYPVDFGGAGLGDNSRLRWNFGDGSENSTNMTPTHVYADPGKYWVCLTVADTVTDEESTECDSVSTQLMCQNDSIDPVAKCKNISISLSGSSKDISPLDVNNSSTDNCGIYDYSLDNKTFTTANEGANLIHLTVTDYNSNTSTCSAIVTVVVTGISSTSVNPSDLIISPNPVSNFMTITYQLPARCNVDLAIYDMIGNRVATINAMKLGAGKQVQTFDASGLMNGSYILQLKTSSGLVTRKIIVKK